MPGTSNPATGTVSFGGVAHNVAVNLTRLGIPARLASAIGADADGRALARHLSLIAPGLDGLAVVPDAPTATYVAVLEPDGNLALGLADMAIFATLRPERVLPLLAAVPAGSLLFADCNLPAETVAALAEACGGAGLRLVVDPVSVAKSARLPPRLDGIDLLILNADEAAAVAGPQSGPAALVDALLERGARSVIVTLGAAGLAGRTAGGLAFAQPAEQARLVDVTGAGDALIAGVIAGLRAGRPLAAAASLGQRAAGLTLACEGSLHPGLSPDRLEAGSLPKMDA